MRKGTLVAVCVGSLALQACGVACNTADCYNRVEGALPAGTDWPDDFCEQASGTLVVDDREVELPEGELGRDVECERGMLSVSYRSEDQNARLELSNGQVRMVVSSEGADVVDRFWPSGRECGLECSVMLTTIEVVEEM